MGARALPLILVFFPLGAGWGCGSKGPDLNPAPAPGLSQSDYPDSSAGEQPSERLKILSQIQVHCADAAACPEGVGFIGVTDSTRVRTCTGFLVAPDIVTTQGSCLRAHPETAPDCAGKVKIAFPPSGSQGSESLECKELLFISGPAFSDQSFAPDFVFFRTLSPSQRKLSLMNQGGMRNQMQVRVAAVDIGSDPLHGTLRVRDCVVLQKTYALPQFDHPGVAVATLGGCDLGAGSLGAPILDDSGKALGVFQKNIEVSLPSFQPTEASIPKFALVSNFACAALEQVPGLGDNDLPSVGCKIADFSEAKTQQLRLEHTVGGSADRLREEREKLFRGWVIVGQQQEQPVLRWKQDQISQDPSDKITAVEILENRVPLPQCFRRPKDWLDRFEERTRSKSNRRKKKYLRNAEFSLSLPRWILSVRQNFLTTQIDSSLTQTPISRVVVRFDAQSVSDYGISEIKVVAQQERESVIFDSYLSLCP